MKAMAARPTAPAPKVPLLAAPVYLAIGAEVVELAAFGGAEVTATGVVAA